MRAGEYRERAGVGLWHATARMAASAVRGEPRFARFAVALAAALLLAGASGCAQLVYRDTSTGIFQGTLDVRWIKPDRFIYMPDKDDPLRFTTADGRVLQPLAMYTDGGSIPRLFWSMPGYSPWGYAPAYIIHDWVFLAHHCRFDEYRDITFERSAQLLAEGIKTLMESGTAPREETILWSIYEAVRSPVARSLWDSAWSCDLPAARELALQPPGESILRIRIEGAAGSRP